MLKNMLEVIVQGLVDDPTQVRVDEVEDSEGVTYQVTVAENDLGKVIGKDGRIANALRSLARSVAAQDDRWARVEIMS